MSVCPVLTAHKTNDDILLDMNKVFFKITIGACCFAGLALNANAQKVTELQEVSIKAPHAIKIDGKNFEWNAADFSVNKRTSISYIMSNDEKNLYLVIKSTDVPNNSKIMAGGITLSVNPDGKKKEKESITLTYPVVNRGNMRGGPGGIRRMGGFGGGGGQQFSAAQRDSMMAAMQKTQLAQAKEIKIKGFKNTTDTLISIYNEYSVKAFASIEKDNSFFYELQIPLAALGLTADKEFAYNIKLNGLQLPGFDGPGGGGGGGFGGGGGGRGPGGGGGGFGGGGGGGRGPGGGGFDFQAMISPTDFWGKYTIKN